jgi:hypothetical protein
MFVYRGRFLTRGEVWFDDQPDGSQVDWIYHCQRSSPLANYRWKAFYTVLVDLRKSPADLFAAMDDKTARKITEAQEKDKLRCEHCDASDARIIAETEAMWNKFAAAQNTPRLDRPWLDQFRQAGVLDVVAARDSSGQVLVYHLVLLTRGRARQLIAISPHRTVPSIAWRHAVSRANCLIHWHNFQSFKEQGITHFDFGGWYPGTTDIQLLGINTFKKSFGGVVVREFDCEQPVTFKGRVALIFAHLWARLRETPPRVDIDSESGCNASEPPQHKVSPAF